jgi:nucleoside-diphosphate-sugar epimerase
MRRPVVLVTGASGEMGHALIHGLSSTQRLPIVSLDLKPLPADTLRLVERNLLGSILDRNLLDGILAEFEVDAIYHLAALLSTRSEFTPLTAHQVNVEGTLNLLEFAQEQARSHGRTVAFFYPSSIAAYGLNSLAEKASAGAVEEDSYTVPRTMYGCNKLYTEQLGRYYSRFYKQLDAVDQSLRVDFRSIRFPGLISADTVPSGGTSDYAPEMIHAAAQGRPYPCFVRPDTRIPFMAMPDAVDAVFALMAADRARLTRTVYNIMAYAPSADEFRTLTRRYFPAAEISYIADMKRQAIVDSWPAAVNDSVARRDWSFAPRFDLEATFAAYLMPAIKRRYSI